jgi:hypothetical protein
MAQDNLAAKRKPEWALFLPAVSSFYINSLGKEKKSPGYFSRTLSKIKDWEQLNYYNKQKGLYYYAHGLYSAGHANLDVTIEEECENIVRKRDRGVFMLGDSGGFQISQGQWPANWRDPNCPKAMAKRREVLTWMEEYMDYGMCLDIPTATFGEFGAPVEKHGIRNYNDAVNATHINNQYFINNRKGECKFLNVLQGTNHDQSNHWYNEMKQYCDPKQYPNNHFNGWAFGGQNKAEIHLLLKRLVGIVYDGFLQEGKHDWIHFLGLSQLEWAVMFTDLQKALRKYWNPSVTLSFDCASPFMSAAKSLIYTTNDIRNGKKWVYRMEPAMQGKQYAGDNRKFSVAIKNHHKTFTDSPITDLLTLGEMNPRGVGALDKHGKETKTSWDTLSYVLLQSHNNWAHLTAVQIANELYETGVLPEMLDPKFDETHKFGYIVDSIFKQKDVNSALAVIDDHSWLWDSYKGGNAFNTGKRAKTSIVSFNNLFEIKEETSKENGNEDADTILNNIDS